MKRSPRGAISALHPRLNPARGLGATRRVLQEPLLHFLLIGVALFVVYDKVAAPDGRHEHRRQRGAGRALGARPRGALDSASPATRNCCAGRVPRARRDPLPRGRCARTRPRRRADQATRSPEDRGHEEEEDARAAAIRRRAPAYMAAHAGRYIVPAKVSFEQIFFEARRNACRGRAGPGGSASRPGARGPTRGKLGQCRCMPAGVENAAQDLVARDFGAEFARQIEAAPVGQWSGPIGRASARIWCA